MNLSSILDQTMFKRSHGTYFRGSSGVVFIPYIDPVSNTSNQGIYKVDAGKGYSSLALVEGLPSSLFTDYYGWDSGGRTEQTVATPATVGGVPGWNISSNRRGNENGGNLNIRNIIRV